MAPSKQPAAFKSSALYLAGRTKGLSTDRVAWMEARNLETTDPLANALKQLGMLLLEGRRALAFSRAHTRAMGIGGLLRDVMGFRVIFALFTINLYIKCG